jgi:hypothetical protein
MIIGDILSRLNLINAIFDELPFKELDNPLLRKYISQTNVNYMKQFIYNLSFIFKATKISLFDLVKQSGKVDYQIGGNPYTRMFSTFLIIIMLLSKTIASSNELAVNSKKSGPAYEWARPVTQYTVTDAIEIPGAKNTPIAFGLKYRNKLNTDLSKLFQDTQRELDLLLKHLRGKCLKYVKENKGYVHIEYIHQLNGLQVIDSKTENPTTYDKDTQNAVCFEINPLPFNFNQETGSIEFIHVNMPLNQITEILNTIVGDMDGIMKDTNKPKPSKEFIEAYNGILIIADGLEKIRNLLFDVFSPVVFNPNMPNAYRIESLEDSFGSIINEMIQMKDLLNLKNPYEQMEASSKLEYAKEELENAKTKALAEESSRTARQIESDQKVKNTKVYYANVIDENMASVQSIGRKISEVPSDFVGAISDAAVNTALAPVNSVLKGAREMIMNNKLIGLLFALGVFVTGVVTIKIRKGIISIVYKIANAIKTIVLMPIKVTIWLGKKVINVLWYKEKVEETPTVLQIENDPGPDVNVVTPVVTPVVENQVAVVAPVVNSEKKIEIQRLENALKNAKDQLIQRPTLNNIKIRISELEDQLVALRNAQGTRKRIAKKNTKKKNLKKRTKPSRKIR